MSVVVAKERQEGAGLKGERHKRLTRDISDHLIVISTTNDYLLVRVFPKTTNPQPNPQ